MDYLTRNLIASLAFRHEGQDLKPGDSFSASGVDATYLTKVGKAKPDSNKLDGEPQPRARVPLKIEPVETEPPQIPQETEPVAPVSTSPPEQTETPKVADDPKPIGPPLRTSRNPLTNLRNRTSGSDK